MAYESGRLIFREFAEADFEQYYSIFSNQQVMTYAWMDQVTSREEMLPYFEKVLENNKRADINRPAYEFGVYLRADGTFIGYTDIEIFIRNLQGGWGEIGYFLRPEFWGYGYASEIVQMVLALGFNQLKLHKISASCNGNNASSERVMQKSGMQKEGVLKQARFKNGRWDDELKYSILVDQWLHSQK